MALDHYTVGVLETCCESCACGSSQLGGMLFGVDLESWVDGVRSSLHDDGIFCGIMAGLINCCNGSRYE